MAYARCLVLLGEPGIGKSRTLDHEYEAARGLLQEAGHLVRRRDLRSFSSEERIEKALFEGTDVEAWRAGTSHYHLFVDSLDECRLRVETAAAVIADGLKELPADRLRLRIACRTAEWPAVLERDLKVLWGDDGLQIVELVQLTRDDVRAAALAEGLDADAFLAEVNARWVGPLAAKPVTLTMLLNIYKRDGTLPPTQAEIYREGLTLLCTELNESRLAAGRAGELTPAQRLSVAGRLAAITVFSGADAVWTAPDLGDRPDTDVAPSMVAAGAVRASGIGLALTEAAVREALSTGLFSSRGAGRLGWQHQTYAEFLAAWHLHEEGITQTATLDLLTNRDPEGRVVPQLREVAAWVGTLNSGVRRILQSTDPLAFVKSDVAAGDRPALVSALLDLFEAESARDEVAVRRHYHRLNHPALADQLRPVIADPRRGWLVRRVAIDIAEACKLSEVQEELARVALDVSEFYPTRVEAARAVAEIGDSKTRARLRPLALGQAGDDPDEELRGYALSAVWPEHLSGTELFPSLPEPSINIILWGGYDVFLREHLASRLPVADLPVALEWVASLASFYGPQTQLDTAAAEILARAWDNLGEPTVLSALARALLSSRRNGLGLENLWERLEAEECDHDNDKRRLVLGALVAAAASHPGHWTYMAAFGALGPFARDLEWLAAEFERASEDARGIWKGLLVRAARDQSLTATVVDLERFLSTLARHAGLEAALRPYLISVELGTPEAVEMRSDYEARLPTPIASEAPPATAQVKYRGDVLRMLEEVESGDLDAWWKLFGGLTRVGPRRHGYGTIASALAALAETGCLEAGGAERDLVLKAAARYLIGGDPRASEWLTDVQSFSLAANAGAWALHLLLGEDEGRLRRLPSDVWGKWVIALPGAFLGSDPREFLAERHRQLLDMAFKRAPDHFLLALGDHIQAGRGAEALSDIARLDLRANSSLSDALISLAADAHLPARTFQALCELLVSVRLADVRALCEPVLASLPAEGEDPFARNLAAARVLVEQMPDAGWTAVWAALRLNPDFGRAFVDAGLNRDDKPLVLAKLTTASLEELYLWIVSECPRKESDPPPECEPTFPAFGIDEWRSGILQTLVGRGTLEARHAVERLRDAWPEAKWLHWRAVNAAENARRGTWAQLSPQRLVAYLEAHRGGSVSGGQEMQPTQELKQTAHPIRILHLSDVHVETTAVADLYRSQLEADLDDLFGPDSVDYLVISGDLVNRASPGEYEAARKLILDLQARLGIAAERTVIVPGNHDLDWGAAGKAYDHLPPHLANGLSGDHIVPAGAVGVLKRDPERYTLRFANFKTLLFDEVSGGRKYPLEPDEQGLLYEYPEHRILFLGLNSSWQIDEFFKERAGIHSGALGAALDTAKDSKYREWLKIAVWHHPVAGPETMRSLDFLERVTVAGFTIAMHGQVHEARNDLYTYDASRGLRVVGAGTFGAPALEQRPGIPLQYNVLELNPSTCTARVHTRKKEKPEGSWSADARWADKRRNPVAYYDIQLRNWFECSKEVVSTGGEPLPSSLQRCSAW